MRFICTCRGNRGSRGSGFSRAAQASRFDTAQSFQHHRAKQNPQPLAMPQQRSASASDGTGTRKAGVWVTIIVAAALAIAVQRFAAHADVSRELRAMVGATNCAARYAALLDLAELARRDGTSSDVVMRGLANKGGMRGAMNECPRLSLSGSAQ